MSFAVIALLGVHPDGTTDECSCEAPDLDQAVVLMRELVTARPNFRAITLVHIEDFPSIMGASEIMDEARRMES